MKNSERIIFVPFIHAFGGVERLVLALSRFLYESNISHTITCFKQTLDLKDHAEWPIKIHELATNRDPVSEGWALYSYMKAAYIRGSPPALLFDLKGSFYAGLLPSLPYYLHLTDPPSLLPSEVSKFGLSLRKFYSSYRKDTSLCIKKVIRGDIAHLINKRGATKALSVIAMTNAIANELRNIYSIDAKIIRPGVRKMMSYSTPLFDKLEHNIKILSVCRLEPNKRIDWMLNVLGELEKSITPFHKKFNWSLDLVGEGSQREYLKKLSKEKGLDNKVFFHGNIPDAKVNELFTCSSFFVMPAAQGYGLPALEALARGVPVILHSESGVSEILKGDPRVIVIGGGIEDLASAINIMVKKICNNNFEKTPLVQYQTENDWAHEVCTECKWL